jgi:molybdopterin converting factor small subunit
MLIFSGILMKIGVRLFSFLCRLFGKDGNRYSFNMDIKKGTTCADLLALLNIPLDLPMVIFVNGMVKDKNYLLQESDEVSLLPPVEGG